MKAEIISTGTEILLGQILNSNAQFLSTKLAELGIDVYYQSTVGDNEIRLMEIFEQAYSRSDLIIVTGGLGPTTDDLTKEAICKKLGEDLKLNKLALHRIQEFFEVRGRKMPSINEKQAMLPQNALVIPNDMGTAPGFIIEKNNKIVVVLPGPPVEMKPMFLNTVEPYLKEKIGAEKNVIVSRVIKILGLGESVVEEKIKDFVDNQTNPTIAFLAPRGEVLVRITAKAKTLNDAHNMIAEVERKIRERLGDYVYGADEDTLEEVVVRLLKKHGLTLSVAESCTGGLVSKRLTDISGISEHFMYGVVSYSNEAKIRLLGVSPKTLSLYGAVSEETAMEMAVGVKNICGTNLAVSVTGIAGPGGGTPEKPVGLVYIGFVCPERSFVKRYLFAGDREVIRWQTANTVLNTLRKCLIEYKA